MNIIELMKAALALLLIGFPVLILGCGAALWAWSMLARAKKPRKPKGPHISLEAPCPACGNIGCMLNYDAPSKVVLRKCVHCGCVLRQQPVVPALFADKK